MGALSLTAKWQYRAPFAPLIGDVLMLPYNDIPALEAAIGPHTAGVFIEPVQGEGGVHPATPEFLQAVRRLSSKHGALMVVDEVQCGLSRSGEPFAHQHSFFGSTAVQPDIMTLAKPLAGGLPIGAVLMKQAVANALLPGDHGSTFSGGPLICAAANVVVEELSKPELVQNVRARSQQLMQGLRAIQADLSQSGGPLRIVDVRGLGLLVGLELSVPVKDVIGLSNHKGLMLISAGDNVIRMCPPLIVNEEQVAKALGIIREAIGEIAAQHAAIAEMAKKA